MKDLERELAIYSGNIIRELRKKHNLTQKELGEKIGVSNSAVANYEKGYRAPLQDTLFSLSDVFDIPIDTFFPEVNRKDISSIYRKLNSTRQAKVYNFAERQLEEQNRDNVVNMHDYLNERLYGYLSAGTGEYLAEDINEEVRIPKSIVPNGEYDLVLQVNGDSMQPMFENHEYVFVKKTTEIRSGQIGVFIIDNESYLKKAYIEDNHLRLVSLNTEYEDLLFDDVNDITVVGTVVM